MFNLLKTIISLTLLGAACGAWANLEIAILNPPPQTLTKHEQIDVRVMLSATADIIINRAYHFRGTAATQPVELKPGRNIISISVRYKDRSMNLRRKVFLVNTANAIVPRLSMLSPEDIAWLKNKVSSQVQAPGACHSLTNQRARFLPREIVYQETTPWQLSYDLTKEALRSVDSVHVDLSDLGYADHQLVKMWAVRPGHYTLSAQGAPGATPGKKNISIIVRCIDNSYHYDEVYTWVRKRDNHIR